MWFGQAGGFLFCLLVSLSLRSPTHHCCILVPISETYNVCLCSSSVCFEALNTGWQVALQFALAVPGLFLGSHWRLSNKILPLVAPAQTWSYRTDIRPECPRHSGAWGGLAFHCSTAGPPEGYAHTPPSWASVTPDDPASWPMHPQS